MGNGRNCDDKAGCLRKSNASALISYPPERGSPGSNGASIMIHLGTNEEKRANPLFGGRYEEIRRIPRSRSDATTISTQIIEAKPRKVNGPITDATTPCCIRTLIEASIGIIGGAGRIENAFG